MAELFTGFNERVRLLINETTETLSNETLESFDFSGIAKITIDNLINLSEPTIEQQDLINSCYVYQTALYALPTLNSHSTKIEQTTHSKVEYFENNKYKLSEMISERLSKCLLMLNCNVGYTSTIFELSNPEYRYRGDMTHI